MINYTLIRSSRKTIAIHITKEAIVEVRSPHKMPNSEIDKFVKSKQKWIYEHLEIVKSKIYKRASFSLNYGDAVLYRGKEYPIIASQGKHIGFDDTCFYVPKNLPADDIKYTVIQIYKLLAKRDLTKKVIEFAKLMNLTPTNVKINSAKTRWGSCSGKNRINFSWLLIMAEDSLIDYVIVHELAHIKEHNHSERFWAVVRQVLPEYKERQLKLKELQIKLSNEDWE